jgi:hypothetical protein
MVRGMAALGILGIKQLLAFRGKEGGEPAAPI